MTRASDFQPGDFVTIADDPHPLTWEVVGVNESANGPLYTLKSGQSGRLRYETADHITRYDYRRLTS